MSGITLALDGATYSATVALLRDGKLVSAERVPAASMQESGGRGEALMPLISTMLAAAGMKPREIGSIICGAGPGSFTSLRVAASIAKGIAVASGAELYPVSSLFLTVAGVSETLPEGKYLSVLPAMRGELFALEVTVVGGIPSADAKGHRIIGSVDAADVAARMKAKVIGPGQEIDAAPDAKGAARIIDQIMKSGPVDLDSWEPDYGRLAEAQVKWEAAHGRPLKA
jgi:tRNA threonylcarbamoyladenosine biosynthesis protein TsaB